MDEVVVLSAQDEEKSTLEKSLVLPQMPFLPLTSSNTLTKCKRFDANNAIFVCSYPKSGTTWTQNIVFQLLSQGRLPLEHISHFAPFFEIDGTWADSSSTDPVPSEVIRKSHQRLGRVVFNTHLRWDMMPKADSARYIYLVRSGKDVCTSFYHHMSSQVDEDGGYTGTWDDFVSTWCSGDAPYGTWCDHLFSWYTPKDPRVLILRYEDLLNDLRDCVRQIIEHCNIEITETALQDALQRMDFNYMKSNLNQFQPKSVRWKKEKNFCFVRKGVVGDHKELFSEENHKIFEEMLLRRFGSMGRIPKYMQDLV